MKLWWKLKDLNLNLSVISRLVFLTLSHFYLFIFAFSVDFCLKVLNSFQMGELLEISQIATFPCDRVPLLFSVACHVSETWKPTSPPSQIALAVWFQLYKWSDCNFYKIEDLGCNLCINKGSDCIILDMLGLWV